MFLLLSSFSLSATERAIPSYWLNNWDKENPIIAGWNAASDSWTIAPSHHPGIQILRAYGQLDRDIITQDSFAFKIDSTIYGDNLQMNSSHLGGCVQETNGELWTEYTHYGKTQLPISVRRSFYMPPHEQYYLVKYTIKSTDGNSHSIKLLDYVISGSDQQWTFGNCESGICKMNRQNAYIGSCAIGVDSSYNPLTTMGSADYNDANANPLSRFAQTGTISDYPEYNQAAVSFGALYDGITLPASGEVVISTIRAFGQTIDDAVSHLQTAKNLGSDGIISLTKQRFTEFLNKGTQPSLSGTELEFYQKSILLLKNSQNPKLGPIASSLHHLYGYKNWMRDSLMAAFMLDAAGYHDEAKLFFDWIPSAQLTDNGAWHTCYDTFTGAVIGFVEPQYDSVGLYLVAMNYHLKVFGDDSWVQGHLTTLRKMASFITNNRMYKNFAMSDRSPWEESTDHHTGEAISQQFYAWSQGTSYGGMLAMASIENKVGSASAASTYTSRAAEIQQAVKSALWDSANKRLYRGVWDDGNYQADSRADSSSMSCVFFGLLSNDEAKSHLNYITQQLTHLGSGIARYTNDPYFYDSIWNPCGKGTMEASMAEPSWPVVTAYVAWSEQYLGIDFSRRLQFMLNVAAYGNMPIGEAADSKDGALIVTSAPDSFEHAGVYVYSTLLKEGKVPSFHDTF